MAQKFAGLRRILQKILPFAGRLLGGGSIGKTLGLLLVLFTALLLVLVPIAFVLALFVYIPAAPAQSALAVRDFFVGVFVYVYWNLLPGLLFLGICLLYSDQLVEKTSKTATLSDRVWIGSWVLAFVLFVLAYASGPESIFRRADPFFYFISTWSLGPSLYSLTIWNSFLFIITATYFLFQILARLGFDRKRFGILFINVLIALALALFLKQIPFFAQLEEFSVSRLFQLTRNYENVRDPESGALYCQTPDARARAAQSQSQNAEEQDAQLAELRDQGQAVSVIQSAFPVVPVPPGIRDDIEIIGITTADINEVNFQWPLDQRVYAAIIDRMVPSENSLLLFDINFIDIKGIFGGSGCGVEFNCQPIGGRELRGQTDILSESIRNSPHPILADYPIEVSVAQRESERNYEGRLAVLNERGRIRHVRNGGYATTWVHLPIGPVVPIAETLDNMGAANVFIDPVINVNRRIPIVIRVRNRERMNELDYDPNVDDSFYPGIAFATALSYYGVDLAEDVEVDFLNGYVKIKNIPERSFQRLDWNAGGMVDVDIMARPNPERTVTIPIDNQGLMNINFRGGLYCFPYHRILDVAWHKPPEKVAEHFENKMALVAMYYATGVSTAKDIHISPYGPMAGIEHQAYGLNTILNQDFAQDAPDIVNLLILLAIALLTGFFQPRVPTWMSFLLSILIAALYIGFTAFVTFDLFSYLHVLPTVLIEQVVVLISFVLFRILAEEENVKFIRNTFSKFVSQDVVDELLANPAAIALGGSKKEVSVFFSDVRGFTTISEALGPEELVQLLNEYLSEMTELIIQYRGTIDKYMGDAIMAFWGAPVENQEHAYFTCVAAIAQVRALHRLQKGWSERDIPVLDIGIGINSGPAVVGNMGSSRRMDYTLMGDTVNLGSRLEGITKTYGVKICISEFTYERVKDRVYARELDLVRVKGKLEPVRIYELMGLREDEDLERLKTVTETRVA